LVDSHLEELESEEYSPADSSWVSVPRWELAFWLHLHLEEVEGAVAIGELEPVREPPSTGNHEDAIQLMK
jgi:hypothetical protein